MVLTASVVLFGLMFLLPPLQRNAFYILNSCVVVLGSYYIETHWFRVTAFAPKTFLLLLVFQFISINMTTFLAYWRDKRAAVRGAWRIPERDLHMLELLGGWSGALLAQKMLHHKNKKRSYQTIFWLVPLLQIGFVVFALQYLNLLHIF